LIICRSKMCPGNRVFCTVEILLLSAMGLYILKNKIHTFIKIEMVSRQYNEFR